MDDQKLLEWAAALLSEFIDDAGDCRLCNPAYKERGLVDPSCIGCNLQDDIKSAKEWLEAHERA